MEEYFYKVEWLTDSIMSHESNWDIIISLLALGVQENHSLMFGQFKKYHTSISADMEFPELELFHFT